MGTIVERRTVDLSAYPDLVVIYLGMRVNTETGHQTLHGLGPKIADSVKARPDGLLLHEDLIYGVDPPHIGMRQYWRDYESLERWSRSEPHRLWWQRFIRDSGGTGFWHEAYFNARRDGSDLRRRSGGYWFLSLRAATARAGGHVLGPGARPSTGASHGTGGVQRGTAV